MRNTSLPCNTCLSFAICIHKNVLRCDDLKEHMIFGVDPPRETSMFIGKIRIANKFPYRIKKFERLFKRKFRAVAIYNDDIILQGIPILSEGEILYDEN